MIMIYIKLLFHTELALAWDSGVDIFLFTHNLRAISYSIIIDNTTSLVLIVTTPGETCGVSHVIID
jgi:hypothetical protein